MTELSPAAQAVLDAFLETPGEEPMPGWNYGRDLAAALRVAIGEIEKARYSPSDRSSPDRWFDGHEAALTGAIATLRSISNELDHASESA